MHLLYFDGIMQYEKRDTITYGFMSVLQVSPNKVINFSKNVITRL